VRKDLENLMGLDLEALGRARREHVLCEMRLAATVRRWNVQRIWRRESGGARNKVHELKQRELDRMLQAPMPYRPVWIMGGPYYSFGNGGRSWKFRKGFGNKVLTVLENIIDTDGIDIGYHHQTIPKLTNTFRYEDGI